MQFIKYCMLFFVFLIATLIGKNISQKYKFRLDELEELKNALNIFKSKIKFTYEPIPEMFYEISNKIEAQIGEIFKNASEKMKKNINAGEAWKQALEESNTNMKKEDIETLKTLSNLLGKVDIEGQISEIELVNNFIDNQIEKAEEESKKNVKMYKTLGLSLIHI